MARPLIQQSLGSTFDDSNDVYELSAPAQVELLQALLEAEAAAF